MKSSQPRAHIPIHGPPSLRPFICHSLLTWARLLLLELISLSRIAAHNPEFHQLQYTSDLSPSPRGAIRPEEIPDEIALLVQSRGYSAAGRDPATGSFTKLLDCLY